MIEGFVVDHGHGATLVSHWIEGTPERGIFGLKLRRRKKIPVQTWRCGRCGHLERYARD